MTTTFVLATANADKASEIRDVLTDAGAPIRLVPRDPAIPEIDESGDTLEANARLKAAVICEVMGQPVIADDTGLEVDALGGEPGVRSARFAGEGATYADNRSLLLDRLDGVDAAKRTARFATVAIARWPDGREVAAIGTVEGSISEAPRGSGGFGYDSIFVPIEGDGRTFAEMGSAEKHSVSHRGRALRTLAEGLRVLAEVGDL
jgi:XTP/dITP diphosphohydrolase